MVKMVLLRKTLYIVMALLVLTGCGAKKKAAQSSIVEEVAMPEEPAWHTCLIQGARATVFTNDDQIAATLTMQTVRDSMLVISVMPMLGIEMFRLEATPLELIAIDKMHGQYAKTTFAELNRKLTPSLNWDVLQQLCTAELPLGSEKARLQYMFGDDIINLVIDYPARQLDVPVRVMNQPVIRYTQIDISRWL